MEGFMDRLDRCCVCGTSYPLVKHESGVILCNHTKCKIKWANDNMHYSEDVFKETGMMTPPILAKYLIEVEWPKRDAERLAEAT